MSSIARAADRAGIARVRVVAWRDLDHLEAGGSEIHLDEILRRWAAAGIEVRLFTGHVPGGSTKLERNGYQVRRQGGRLTGLVRIPRQAARWSADATVEVWHGINFCGPLWIRGPRLAIVHHVHRDEFAYVLPRPGAWIARHHEGLVSPRLYNGTPLVTLSDPARAELAGIGFAEDSIAVVPPGVSSRFSPGGQRATKPTILTVARLWPQKRVDRLVDAMVALGRRNPSAELLVVGDGPVANDLAGKAAAAKTTVHLLGHVDNATLLNLYRSAWVLASASVGEGWGMTITEAGACGTPAVVSSNAGHRHAVIHGVTGYVADDTATIASYLDQMLSSEALRCEMGQNALQYARTFSWDSAASSLFDILATDALQRRAHGVNRQRASNCWDSHALPSNFMRNVSSSSDSTPQLHE